MKARFDDRILARNLRSQGFSFSEIRERIPRLSKSTLSGWLNQIELTQKQKDRLLLKIKKGSERGRLKGALTNHKRRIAITKKIIDESKKEVKNKIHDSFFLAGVFLYWAEGDKTAERVAFTNADPLMIQFMMKWFREVCRVPEEKFRIVLNIMTLHDKEESEQFWSHITSVPLRRFHKTRIKNTPLKGKRNPSYQGTCRIIISDKNVFRKVLGWKLGSLENFHIGEFAPMAQRIEQVNSNH